LNKHLELLLGGRGGKERGEVRNYLLVLAAGVPEALASVSQRVKTAPLPLLRSPLM
jgi:hypothetical protein